MPYVSTLRCSVNLEVLCHNFRSRRFMDDWFHFCLHAIVVVLRNNC